MLIKETEYKGKKVLGFYESETAKFPSLAFGAMKAQVIVQNFNAIKAWSEKNQPTVKVKAKTKDELAADNARLMALLSAKGIKA